MTLDLAAVRDREAAATPGPWYASRRLPEPAQPGGPHLLICDAGWDFDDPEYGHSAPVIAAKPATGWPDTDDHRAANADAEFIAHAREDVPALLAEVDRLRALLADVSR